jgi:hypothetical protein
MIRLRCVRPTQAWIALLFALLISMTNVEVAMAGESVERQYAEGQVWTFRARAGEEGATLLINKVEEDPRLGAIYHISVFGVRLDNPRASGGATTELPHFPVSRETLDKSCLELQGVREPNPEYLRGYGEWREVFDAGRAGVFDISVADIVDIVQSAIAQSTVQ